VSRDAGRKGSGGLAPDGNPGRRPGGCRLLTLLKNGAIDEVDCRKGYYDETLEKIILQDLRYGGNGKRKGTT
jgi:hypothetical protein